VALPKHIASSLNSCDKIEVQNCHSKLWIHHDIWSEFQPKFSKNLGEYVFLGFPLILFFDMDCKDTDSGQRWSIGYGRAIRRGK